MRFAVLGATGMAGHMLAVYLNERGHDVTGTYRSSSALVDTLGGMGINMRELDAIDSKSVVNFIDSSDADFIVNCIGLLNDDCNRFPDRAVYLNAYLPRQLVSLCGSEKKVIHISTDCVFAGNTGPYSELSIPDGATLYDRTKALGEFSSTGHLVLRQSIVGPDPNVNGIGLLNWFMQQHGSVKGWTKAIWTGLTTLELAKAVESCAENRSSGLINMVPNGLGVSKFDLLCLFNKYMCGNEKYIVPVDGLCLDKSLVRTNFDDASFLPACYEKQIEELADWMGKHLKLYPHYQAQYAIS